MKSSSLDFETLIVGVLLPVTLTFACADGTSADKSDRYIDNLSNELYAEYFNCTLNMVLL